VPNPCVHPTSARARRRVTLEALYGAERSPANHVGFLVALRSFVTMNRILRFSGAVKRDPAIDAWIKERASELGSIAQQWFDVMRECGHDVRELIHDGCPVACVEDAPFGYVNVFKAHVNVGFFHGAELPDPAGLLEGSGKRMRHVKLKPEVAIDSMALSGLVEEAYLDIKGRLEAG
jgi:hypothetical protein